MKDPGNFRSVGRWISVLYRQSQVYINNELKAFDLSSSQFYILIHLFKENGVSQETLAAYQHIDKSAAARALKQLEEKGYIIRSPSPGDKRCNLVSYTDKAFAIKEQLFQILKDWNRKVTAGYSSDEYDMIYSFLMGMAEEALNINK